MDNDISEMEKMIAKPTTPPVSNGSASDKYLQGRDPAQIPGSAPVRIQQRPATTEDPFLPSVFVLSVPTFLYLFQLKALVPPECCGRVWLLAPCIHSWVCSGRRVPMTWSDAICTD